MNKEVADLSETPIPFDPKAPLSENEICKKIQNSDCSYEVFNEGVAGESSPIASTSGVKSPLVSVRGVKRPHSLDLQNLSEEECTLDLYCYETMDDLEKSNDGKDACSNACVEQYGEDLLKCLILREYPNATLMCSESWTEIVNLVIKVNGQGGNSDVVQTTIWLLFCMAENVEAQDDNHMLVIAACYWLSKKIHNGHIPAVSVVETFENVFTCNNLFTVENRVLETLNFPLAYSTTPQELISFMSYIYEGSGEVEGAATIFHMASNVIYNTYICLYPSGVAVAAVSNALHMLDRQDLLEKLEMDDIYKEAKANVYSLSVICAVQREAIRIMSSPGYEHDALLQQNETSIVERVVDSAKRLKELDQEMFQEELILLCDS